MLSQEFPNVLRDAFKAHGMMCALSNFLELFQVDAPRTPQLGIECRAMGFLDTGLAKSTEHPYDSEYSSRPLQVTTPGSEEFETALAGRAQQVEVCSASQPMNHEPL